MIHIKRIIKSILKYKTLSGLTLLSLVISFTGIIILSLYISYEKSFESFHENKSSVFLLKTPMYAANVPARLSEPIKNNIPEIEDLEVLSFSASSISTPKLNAENINYHFKYTHASNSFFQMFSYPLVLGNKETILSEPFSAVISETLAKKLFGDINPIGENILFDDENYKVEGIMKDFPKNSSIKADCLFSFVTLTKNNRRGVNSWNEWGYQIFVQLKKNVNPSLVSEKIVNIEDIKDMMDEYSSRYPNEHFIQFTKLSDLHFNSDSYNFSYTNPTILNVLILLVIILAVMGIVNFINFSTAQAPLRSKALSILQVMGGRRFSSMLQIILESIILSIVAIAISFIIYWLIAHAITSLFNIEGILLSGRYHFIFLFLLFAILFGIIAGIYPARYITSSPISQTVKGNAHFKGKGTRMRNSLVILQFIFTITLLSSAFVIEKQLSYWRNFDIGIDKEHVVFLYTTKELRKHHQALADELLKHNEISNYSYTQFKPGQVGMGWGRTVDGQRIELRAWPVDDRFIDFFGIEIEDGRKFNAGPKSDINSFIMNRKAIEQFGWENPLERQLTGLGFTGPIMGVAKNFNFASLKEEVQPMAFWRTESRKYILLLRLKPGNYTKTFTDIYKTIASFDPKYNGGINFLDDDLNIMYNKEEKAAHFIEFVALWCILLALTGILGLMFFISRDRTKEIGIRKVNGAKVSEVLAMLNKDFVKWVAIAFGFACPIAYYAMNKWLENFAYKTTLSWWIFALAGVLALGIALLTVSWQSWRAATRNPVEALRYE